jgi:hypothetical protein
MQERKVHQMYGVITFATFQIEHTEAGMADQFRSAFHSGRLAEKFGFQWPETSLPLSKKGRDEMRRLIKSLPHPTEIAPHVYGCIQSKGPSKLVFMLVVPWPDPKAILELCERAGFEGIGNWTTVVDYVWDKPSEKLASH